MEDYEIIDKLLRMKIFKNIDLTNNNLKIDFNKKINKNKILKYNYINFKRKEKIEAYFYNNNLGLPIKIKHLTIKNKDTDYIKNNKFIFLLNEVIEKKTFKNIDIMILTLYYSIIKSNVYIFLSIKEFVKYIYILYYFVFTISLIKNKNDVSKCSICFDDLIFYKNYLCCNNKTCLKCYILSDQGQYKKKCSLCNSVFDLNKGKIKSDLILKFCKDDKLLFKEL